MTRPLQDLAKAREARTKRRQAVARLRREGVLNQQQIAKHLGASKSTIHADFQAIDREWTAAMVEDVDLELRTDLARLEELLQVAYPKALAGDLKAVDRVLKIIDRRRRMLGYSLPKTVRVEHDLVIRQYVGIDPAEFDQGELDMQCGIARE